MAWSSPITVVAGGIFSAAIFNQYIRDNLNETSPAKATVVSSWFPVSGVNQITERSPLQANATGSSTTTASAYGNLADAITTSVTVTTGTKALVLTYCNLLNSANGNRTWMSYEVSGATTIAADDTFSVNHSFNGGMRWGAMHLPTLTAGSNTFTLRYRVTAGTGTFSVRRIGVIPF